MKLIALRPQDIPLGQPVPFPIYDEEGTLLLDDGIVIDSRDQLEFLFKQKLYREGQRAATPQPTEETGAARSRAPAGPPPDDSPASRPQATRKVAKPASDGAPGYSFDDMKLQAEDRVQVQLASDSHQQRHYTRLLGWARDQGLIIATPSVAGLPLPLTEGEEVIVRVFSGQAAYAFTVNVERICQAPFLYFHTSFPTAIQGLMIRKSTRVKINLAASIATEESVSPLTGLITNISVSGALVDCGQPLGKKNDALQLSFPVQISDFQSNLTLGATIRSINENTQYAAGVPALHHGVEFTALQPFDKVLLQTLVYQQLIGNPHNVAGGFAQNSTALASLESGGARHPHVYPYTLRWLRSVLPQDGCARDEFFRKPGPAGWARVRRTARAIKVRRCFIPCCARCCSVSTPKLPITSLSMPCKKPT